MNATEHNHGKPESGGERREVAGRPGAGGGSGPRRVAGFVAVFLVATVSLLTAYHYGQASRPMQAYLYYIAIHTNAVLSLTGESAVENPRIHEGEEAAIRARLRAAGAPGVTQARNNDEPPLTPWEVWQHRVLRLHEDQKAVHFRESALALPERPVMDSRETHAAYVTRLIQRLETVVEGPEGVEPSAAAGVAALIHEGRELLEKAAADEEIDIHHFTGMMHEAEQVLGEAWQRQSAHVQRRRARLRDRWESLGPHIHYVRANSLEHQLRQYRQTLKGLENANAAGATPPGNGEAGVVQAELEAIEKELAARRSGEDNPNTGAFIFGVVSDCSAIPPKVIFFSAILAFPTRWRKKAVGVLAGLPLLYATNIVRLASLGVIGSYTGPGETFDFVHHYVWQGVYIAIVVVLWMMWMEFLVKGNRPWARTNKQPA